jgi:hypothetical protein
MRPVDKGVSPNTYTNYKKARNDLIDKIGGYCSYCEMHITNMIEVEHVHPTSQGGPLLDWDNFLLACKYCNNVKLNRNTSRNGYLWPDQDNTDLVFEYSEMDVIKPKNTNLTNIQTMAQGTIDLMGLDRKPSGRNEPTEADLRWIFREMAWTQAKNSEKRWKKCPTPEMAEQIADTSLGGFYSIWMVVFKNEPLVLTAIEDAHKNIGLFKEYLPTTGQRIVRTNGNI